MIGRAHSSLEQADRTARLASQTVFDRPVVLEAGAGTGKTTALVARIAAWTLGAGWERATAEEAEAVARSGRKAEVEPERIAARALDGTVAITFTEAAAAEMAVRVGLALRELAEGATPLGMLEDGLPPGEATRRDRARALLTALDHLRASTIHAFCRRLLAANPLEAGVHPAFTVDADGRALEERARAVVEERYREALSSGADADVLTLAAAGLGGEEIREAILALAGSGVPVEALADEARWHREAGELVTELAAAADAVGSLVTPRVAGSGRLAKPAEVARACGHIAARLAEKRADVAVARSIVEGEVDDSILERLADWSRGKLNQSESDAFGEVADRLGGEAGRLRDAARLVLSLDGALFAAGGRVVGAWLAETRERLRRDGIASFSDLLHGCRDLLLRAPAVAARERRAIRQLLVDEFQDTDTVQCEILSSLALAGSSEDRPGLFLVGDPKQSIYGWRNADLAAYQAFVVRVLELGGELHRLSVNFRSVEAILAEVDAVVRPAMRPEPGWQPAFEPLVVGPARSGDHGFDAGERRPVEYWATPAPQDDGDAIEPRAVAADIRELHDLHAVPWGEFAVLLRAATELDAYLHAMREAAIPYVVERDRSYYRRREVIDASALIRAVLDPHDHVALIAWLRSAAVGVPDAALVPLWERRFPGLMSELAGPDPERLATLATVVAGSAAATPAVPGLERIAGWDASLAAAVEKLAELRQSFARDPAAAFVEQLRTGSLLEGTEAARVLGRYRVANLDRLFRTLLEEVDGRGADPEAMLAILRQDVARRRDAEEGRLRDELTDAVRVMTIHKAKGLDFTHVYLVDAGRKLLHEKLPRAAAEQAEGAWEAVLFGVPSPGWGRVAARRRRVAEAELVRTLYVAMTRAKRRLVVAGTWEKVGDARTPSHLTLIAGREGGMPADASGRVEEGSVLWRGLTPSSPPARPPAEGIAARAPVDQSRVAAEASALTALQEAAASRMARPFSGPASREAHRLLRESFDDGEGEGGMPSTRSGSRGGAETATIAGTLVHRLLERLDLSDDIAEQVAGWTARMTMLEGARQAVVERAAEIVARFRTSSLPARLAEIAGWVVARELPVLFPPHGNDGPVGVVAGSVDLLYRDPHDGSLVVADFKTDRVEGRELAARVEAYRPQLEAYARALADALETGSPTVMELWFLWPGRIIRLEA